MGKQMNILMELKSSAIMVHFFLVQGITDYG